MSVPRLLLPPVLFPYCANSFVLSTVIQGEKDNTTPTEGATEFLGKEAISTSRGALDE